MRRFSLPKGARNFTLKKETFSPQLGGLMDYDGNEDEMTELLAQFEEALRAHLRTSEEFQNLIAHISKKHGSISLYVAAQVMGGGAEKIKRRTSKRPIPVRYEVTRGDMKFLRSLKIRTDI
jgi:hypothetical protein